MDCSGTAALRRLVVMFDAQQACSASIDGAQCSAARAVISLWRPRKWMMQHDRQLATAHSYLAAIVIHPHQNSAAPKPHGFTVHDSCVVAAASLRKKKIPILMVRGRITAPLRSQHPGGQPAPVGWIGTRSRSDPAPRHGPQHPSIEASGAAT